MNLAKQVTAHAYYKIPDANKNIVQSMAYKVAL